MLQKLKVTSYALIILLLLVLPSQAAAQCNTQDACAAAAQAKGLILGGNGYDFSGSYQTKGCYSYDGGKYSGMAYFGTGGTRAEMETVPAAPKYRISCADTVAAQENMGVCEPIEVIKAMKDGPRNHDYILWVDRCQESGSKGQCGHPPEWPVGDGGRCAMSSAAASVSAHDVNSPPVLEKLNPAIAARSQAIADCEAGVIERYKEERYLCGSIVYSSGDCSAPRDAKAQSYAMNTCTTGVDERASCRAFTKRERIKC